MTTGSTSDNKPYMPSVNGRSNKPVVIFDGVFLFFHVFYFLMIVVYSKKL